jgi:serine/threonine kinase 32
MVFRERNLLARLRHPRLVNMHYAFQDEAHLYIIMDACLGGDLHYQIMQSATRRFTEIQVRPFVPSFLVLPSRFSRFLRIFGRFTHAST